MLYHIKSRRGHFRRRFFYGIFRFKSQVKKSYFFMLNRMASLLSMSAMLIGC